MYVCSRGCESVVEFVACRVHAIGEMDGELSILLNKEGQATNRWEDGTVGVPEDVRLDAEEHSIDCPPVCPDCGAMAVYV